jgi:anti-anti-sigma factor
MDVVIGRKCGNLHAGLRVVPVESARPRTTVSAMSVTVAVEGELDITTVGALRNLIEHLHAQQQPVVLDLAGLTFIDSSGVNLLWEACRNGRRVTLTRAHGMPARVLEMSGLPLAEAEA